MKIELYNGKYTYCINEDGSDQHALRYGERWRDLTGDNFIYAMGMALYDKDERIAELEEVLQKLHNLGGLGLDKHKWIEDVLKGGDL